MRIFTVVLSVEMSQEAHTYLDIPTCPLSCVISTQISGAEPLLTRKHMILHNPENSKFKCCLLNARLFFLIDSPSWPRHM